MLVSGPQKTAVHHFAEQVLVPKGFWGLCTRIGSYLFGASVSQKILPSQVQHDDDFVQGSNQLLRQFERKLSTPEFTGYTANRFFLKTYDDALLETMEIKHPAQEQNAPNQQQYMICLVGNGMCYQDILRDMLDDSKSMQFNVLSFNYRNVLDSDGDLTSQLPLILDVISQMERLKQQGIDPANIHILGHSFGAAVATVTAAIYHMYGERPDLVNGRSFSSAADFLYHQQPEGWQRMIWGNLDRLKLALTNLNLNPVEAYLQIHPDNREYFYVKKMKANPSSKPDGVIDHIASFHKGVKSISRGLFFTNPAQNPVNSGQKVISTNRLENMGHNDSAKYLNLPDDSSTACDRYRSFFTRPR